MADSSLKQKTAKGLLWGGISNGLQQLIGISFGILMMRILTPDDYGLFGMLTIFSAIATSLVTSGFSVALTNKQDVCHRDYNAVFWFTFWGGLLLYLVLFFCAPLIALFYERPELTNLSRILFLGMFFSSVGTVSYTILFKELMTKEQSLIDIVSLLTASIVGIILALSGFAYWALAIQTILFLFLTSLIKFIVAPWKPTFHFDFSPLKDIFPFSIRLVITNIITQINVYIFSPMLGKIYDAEQAGYYYQGQNWMIKGSLFIGGMITYVAQPILIQVNDDPQRQLKVLRKMIRFGAFISFPLMLGLAFVGKEFFMLIDSGSEKWLFSVPYLQLLCIWGAFGYLTSLFTNLIYTHGKSKIFMWVTIVTCLLQLMLVICMYPFGIFPMIITYVAMFFVNLLIWQYYVYKLIGLRLKDTLKDILPYLGITIACFAIVWLITKNIVNLYLLFSAKVVISGLLYVVIMKLSNSVMFRESMAFLLKIIKK
jgi:O-antigen/teichoic acid export membrane protein